MTYNIFSWSRFMAILNKEFVQMRRDRLTFAMMIGVPLLQLILFGFAINFDPKELPAAVLVADKSPYVTTLLQGLANTNYLRITKEVASQQEGDALLAQGKILFLITIPVDFTRKLLRAETPQVLIEADNTDPAATANVLSALKELNQPLLDSVLKGSFSVLQSTKPAVEFVMHAKYNPENVSQYYILPGLLGVVLTITMILITSIAITREYERGTMESLLTTPAKPSEIILGKMSAYILVGYVQVALILFVSHALFHVPLQGSVTLLLFLLLPFIAANLAIGLMFSSIATNQLQASQMTYFFFLPSLLLSGFMFPFEGMPRWAQLLGEAFPLTHFLRIVRGIILKGNGVTDFGMDMAYLFGFLAIMLVMGIRSYRQTLD